jgi:MFS family permease
MARLRQTLSVDRAQLARLRTPRTDFLIERPDGPDRWTIEEGPFYRYQRTLEVASNPDPDGRFQVTERFDYRLAVPLWWPYLFFPVRAALRTTNREPRRRVWWPKEIVSANTSTLVALLGTLGMIGGYVGVVIGQSITFASAEFGVDDAVQANTLAAVRIGVALSTVLLWMADRRGRRPLLIGLTLGSILFTVLGGFSGDMVTLGVTQAIARGLTTGMATLSALAAAEEVPASSRALAISFLSLMSGLGAAFVALMLPLADQTFQFPLITGEVGGWRLIYLLPTVFFPLAIWAARRLPETQRYEVAEEYQTSDKINWWWFTLVAFTSFTAFIFFTPASQLRNEYLVDDLNFTGERVLLFLFVASIPATIAVPAGGYIADRFGRKGFGSFALATCSVFIAISFLVGDNAILWITAPIGAALALSTIPALRGYGIELFPTRARGKVGGWLDLISVSGSATGLLIVGALAVRWDNLGQAVAVTAPAAVITAAVILLLYPETAQKELEEFNPGDQRLPRRTDAAEKGPAANDADPEREADTGTATEPV